jgi:hypothetical protein
MKRPPRTHPPSISILSLGLHGLKRTPTLVNMARLHSAGSSRLPNTFFELLSLLLTMTRRSAQGLRMIKLDQNSSCTV